MKLRSKKQEGGDASLDVVVKTRRQLSRRGGWKKGSYKGSTTKTGITPVCFIQGLNDNGDGKATIQLCLDTINEMYGPKGDVRKLKTVPFKTIPDFNDAPGVKKLDILNVAERVISKLGGEEPVGVMQVVDPKAGDRHVHWDPTREAEVEDAKASFDFLTKEKGYFAYMVEEVKGKFKAGKQVKEFDPSIGRLILRPAMVGG
jgi:hypothetical protein